jgi:hypothetical protein
MSEVETLLEMLHMEDVEEEILRQRRAAWSYESSINLERLATMVPQEVKDEATRNGLSLDDYIACCYEAAKDPYDEKTWRANRETRPALKERFIGKIKGFFSGIGNHWMGIVFWGVLLSISGAVLYAAFDWAMRPPSSGLLISSLWGFMWAGLAAAFFGTLIYIGMDIVIGWD